MIEDIVKRSPEFAAMKKEFANGKFASSLLLSCKDDIYAFEFCRNLACLIFDGNACGKCENCQKVYAGAHPDLKIYPAKDKLVVAESEEIVMESFVKPIFASAKVFIIKNLDLAADIAQNKLLKILEEPPQNVFFLITCTSLDAVLPTIRSRCQKIELSRIDDKQILSFLGGITKEEKENIVAVCDGRLGKAIELSRNKDFESVCKDCVQVFTKMKSSKEVLSFSKRLQDHKDQTDLILQIMAIFCGDLFKIKAGKRELVRLKNFESEMNAVLGEYTLRAICEISRLLDEVSKEKSFNVNQTLAIENFLLNILEVKYLCK